MGMSLVSTEWIVQSLIHVYTTQNKLQKVQFVMTQFQFRVFIILFPFNFILCSIIMSICVHIIVCLTITVYHFSIF